ncbi:MAG: cation transporting ATPase C-terminal domain-containing protein [Polyangiaceae bacterium]
MSSSLNDVALWAVTASALLFMALVLYVPFLAHLFRFAALGPLDVALCGGSGALSVGWFELVKRRSARASSTPSSSAAPAGATR